MNETGNDNTVRLMAARDNQEETAAIYGKLSDMLVEKEFFLLVSACIAGKGDSQKKMYYIFYDFANSICLRYAGNHDDAIEIINDGFLKVFKNLNTFRQLHENPIIDFKAWLKKIMIYTAIDHLRKKNRSAHVFISEETNGIADVDETQLEKISYKEIMECVQKLSPAYRAVFCLFVIDGFKHEEIAKYLGIAVGTSKSNLAKAKANLQQTLMARKNFNQYESRAV